MDRYIWQADEENDDLAWISAKDPEGLGRKDYLLYEGVACAAWFPADVTYLLDKQAGIKLSDSIPNTNALLFVSEKLRAVLEKRSGAEIEYLPVRIQNQKGKLVTKPYFIANVLGTLACVDGKKSDLVMSKLEKDQVQRFKRLVLDEGRIPKDANLFRLAEKRTLFVVRRDLAEAILDAGCTGSFFREVDDWGSEFRG